MGPSGSGKSTLLAVLSGLLRPDRGEVMVLGEDLWRMSERARERFRLRHFGFVFQGFNLFPSLTAREQLEMVVRWGEGASRREARRRVAEMLDQLGLGPPRRRARRPALRRGEAARGRGPCPAETARSSASPTSRPARSTGATASRSFGFCTRPATTAAPSCSWSATTRGWCPTPIASCTWSMGDCRTSPHRCPRSPPHDTLRA